MEAGSGRNKIQAEERIDGKDRVGGCEKQKIYKRNDDLDMESNEMVEVDRGNG